MGSIGGSRSGINGDFKIKSDNNQESGSEDERGINDMQTASDHVKHLLTEKRRRKKMKSMFQELHALLPKQTPKAKLLTIVDDAITYIRNLQQTLQKLETQKLERLNHPSTNTSVASSTHPQMLTADGSSSTSRLDGVSCPKFDPLYFPLHTKPLFQTWASSNVTLNICGQEAHISICSSKNPGLLSAVCGVLEKCNVDIVSLHMSSDQSKSMFMIHVRVNASEEFLAAYSYEEIYKLAALEMMLLVN